MDDRLLFGLIGLSIFIITFLICCKSIKGFMNDKYGQWTWQYQIGGYVCMNIAVFSFIFSIGNIMAVFMEYIL